MASSSFSAQMGIYCIQGIWVFCFAENRCKWLHGLHHLCQSILDFESILMILHFFLPFSKKNSKRKFLFEKGFFCPHWIGLSITLMIVAASRWPLFLGICPPLFITRHFTRLWPTTIRSFWNNCLKQILRWLLTTIVLDPALQHSEYERQCRHQRGSAGDQSTINN